MAGLIFNNGSVKIGYNGIPWSFSFSPTDTFMHTCAPTTRPVKSFREEAIIASSEIRSTFQDEQLYVLYSGGIDSEAILEAFRIARVDVTVVIIEFTDGSNAHDIAHARDYLKRTEYTGRLKIIPFDVKRWFASDEACSYARELQSNNVLFTPLLKAIQDNLYDGIAIVGHEEPTIHRNDTMGKWVWNRDELHYSLHKLFIRDGKHGIPSFFQWSTELLAAFVFNKHYNAAYSGLHNPTIERVERLKYSFYFEEFGLPQRLKYTGFEFLVSDILQLEDRYFSTLPFKWDRTLDIGVDEWAAEINYRKQM
jgi:hypothetical protein